MDNESSTRIQHVKTHRAGVIWHNIIIPTLYKNSCRFMNSYVEIGFEKKK